MKGVSKKKKFQNTQFSIQAEHYKGKPIKRWRRKAKGLKHYAMQPVAMQ